MLIKSELILIAVSHCFAVQIAHAQAIDTEFWSDLRGQAKISKGWRGSFRVGLRLDNAGRDHKSTHAELRIRHRFADALFLGVAYRYIYTGQSTHRVAADVLLRAKLGESKIRLGYRGRLQARFDNNTELMVRNRLKANRSFDWAAPFAYFELAFRIDKGEFRRYRVGIGVEWSLGKRTDLSTSYIFRKEINVGAPETDHIFNLNLSHGFKGLF